MDLLASYALMCKMRYFEDEVYRLFLRNLVKGSTHLGSGQEAVAAGFAAAMYPSDYVLATYRGHAHVLAKGVEPRAVFAEMMGKQGGLNKGKGGSMHLTSVEHRMMGCYAIVGAHLPVANGLALASKMRHDKAVVCCFFGDGATNIGAFHEALNLAAVWALPVVFVCENNLYMEYTPIREMIAVDHPAADRAGGYGLERVVVDGNDVVAVNALAESVVARARSGGGPALVEALTYRLGGHSRADPGTSYRSPAEIDAWQQRDPLKIARQRLVGAGVGESEMDRVEAEAREAIAAASAAAMASSDADESEVQSFLWADGGAKWQR